MTIHLSVALQPPLDALFPPTFSGFDAQAERLHQALAELSALSRDPHALLLDGDAGIAVSPYVHVFVNGSHVPPAAVAAQPLKDGDELCLLTAIRGG
jgi:sulfur-carrier protein